MLQAAVLKPLVAIHVQLRLDVVQAVALRWLHAVLAELLLVVQVVVVQAAAPKWPVAIRVELLRLAIAVADVVRRRAAVCSRRSSHARRRPAAMQVHVTLVDQLLAAPAARARHLLQQPRHQLQHQVLQLQHQALQLQLSIQVLT